VNSKEENSKDFCHNYVQEFGLRTFSMCAAGFQNALLHCCHKKTTITFMREVHSCTVKNCKSVSQFYQSMN
jgi:hypothetical protein